MATNGSGGTSSFTPTLPLAVRVTLVFDDPLEKKLPNSAEEAPLPKAAEAPSEFEESVEFSADMSDGEQLPFEEGEASEENLSSSRDVPRAYSRVIYVELARRFNNNEAPAPSTVSPNNTSNNPTEGTP